MYITKVRKVAHGGVLSMTLKTDESQPVWCAPPDEKAETLSLHMTERDARDLLDRLKRALERR